jgi:NAD+ kinase
MLRAHQAHVNALRAARRVLRSLGTRATFRHRSSHGAADAFDLVVTLGGDGTLLFASQSIGAHCPVVAINSAPLDSVGYFCAASGEHLRDAIVDALAGKLATTRLTRLRVEIDGKPCSNRVLNDALFSHAVPAATTRYAIHFRGRQEQQRSSGVWVATAAGSTAAIHSAGGRVLPIASTRLQFLVREPYMLGKQRPSLLRGLFGPGGRLELQSQMRAGRLYLDGPHGSHPVEIGARLAFTHSDEPLSLLGFHRRAPARS